MTVFDEALSSIKNLFEKNSHDKCKKACELVLSIQSSNPTALYFSGKLSEVCGDIEEASEYYRQLSLIFPFNNEYMQLAIQTNSACEKDVSILQNEIEKSKASILNFPNRPSLRYCKNSLGEFAVPSHPSNDQIAVKICQGELFEPEIIDIAKQYIQPGSIAIDVGSNLGQMSLVFSALVGKEGKVYSIEADDYLHHILKVNTQLNQAKNIITLCKAAWESDDCDLCFPIQDFAEYHCYGAYGLNPKLTSSSRMVKTMTIDSLKIDKPVSFMKVDVQGADLFALRGAVETIKRYRFPIIFEYEEEFQEKFNTSFQDYVDYVASINYKFLRTVKDINYIIVPK
ncbi:FkbM family methyltransferase [Spirulina subsalsa FACHB-351]|uniref:FkbM family methyltransferase n=1 Tax=Spirulina subsalsa FACHB-351 TaxID=234711 RepID=A0ABT3L8R5_9CYAN|nr:FkbM family methyltransferase [Spirulina subsalsa]MCW6037903.1 FkbM family methyltransferase [Spirulina subsalsa FACHB-351]